MVWRGKSGLANPLHADVVDEDPVDTLRGKHILLAIIEPLDRCMKPGDDLGGLAIDEDINDRLIAAKHGRPRLERAADTP
jgi:hypothetical protein